MTQRRPISRLRAHLAARNRALLGYDIFVSYRRSDGEHYARALAGSLKELAVFLDEEELEDADPLSVGIQAALGRSRLMVLLLTPGARASSWIARELEWYLHRGRGRGRVLPVFVGGVTPEEWPELSNHLGIVERDIGTPSANTLSAIRACCLWPSKRSLSAALNWTTVAALLLVGAIVAVSVVAVITMPTHSWVAFELGGRHVSQLDIGDQGGRQILQFEARPAEWPTPGGGAYEVIQADVSGSILGCQPKNPKELALQPPPCAGLPRLSHPAGKFPLPDDGFASCTRAVPQQGRDLLPEKMCSEVVKRHGWKDAVFRLWRQNSGALTGIIAQDAYGLGDLARARVVVAYAKKDDAIQMSPPIDGLFFGQLGAHLRHDTELLLAVRRPVDNGSTQLSADGAPLRRWSSGSKAWEALHLPEPWREALWVDQISAGPDESQLLLVFPKSANGGWVGPASWGPTGVTRLTGGLDFSRIENFKLIGTTTDGQILALADKRAVSYRSLSLMERIGSAWAAIWATLGSLGAR